MNIHNSRANCPLIFYPPAGGGRWEAGREKIRHAFIEADASIKRPLQHKISSVQEITVISLS